LADFEAGVGAGSVGKGGFGLGSVGKGVFSSLRAFAEGAVGTKLSEGWTLGSLEGAEDDEGVSEGDALGSEETEGDEEGSPSSEDLLDLDFFTKIRNCFSIDGMDNPAPFKGMLLPLFPFAALPLMYGIDSAAPILPLLALDVN